MSSLSKKIEHFGGEINDYYSQYFNEMILPAEFYSQGKYASGFPLAEFKDRFFIDTLDKNIKKIDYTVIEDKNIQIPKTLLERCNNYIVKILNAELPSDEPNLFSNVYGEITDIKKLKNNMFLLESKHLIHRDKKIYGASLMMQTIHQVDSTNLLSYKFYGFVFDDKININQPSNLSTDNYQSFMKDNVFMKDNKYETLYLCQYYKDLEKFRGVKVPTDLNCDMIVDDEYL